MTSRRIIFTLLLLLLFSIDSVPNCFGNEYTALGAALGDAAVDGINEFIAGVGIGAGLAKDILDGSSTFAGGVYELSSHSSTARSCAIEIRNYHLNLELINPVYFVERGVTQNPPPPVVAPGTREICMFRKTHGPATGSYGVLTYQIAKVLANKTTGERKIENDGTTLMLMWGIPWGWEWYSSYQAIGIENHEVSVNYDLFKKMYYETGNFKRATPGPLIYENIVYGNIRVKISATLSDQSLATWIIHVQ